MLVNRDMSRTSHHSKRHWKGRKARLWHDGGWISSEPKIWRKLYKHRKRRAETRRKLYEASICEEKAEDTVFPVDKKPWIYYY